MSATKRKRGVGRKERRRLQKLAAQWQAPQREREPIRVDDPARLKEAIEEGIRRAEETARNMMGQP